MKNTLNIALDLDEEKKEAVINIHIIINGKTEETALMNIGLKESMDFPDFWKMIGEKIHKELKTDTRYDKFGS